MTAANGTTAPEKLSGSVAKIGGKLVNYSKTPITPGGYEVTVLRSSSIPFTCKFAMLISVKKMEFSTGTTAAPNAANHPPPEFFP